MLPKCLQLNGASQQLLPSELLVTFKKSLQPGRGKNKKTGLTGHSLI